MKLDKFLIVLTFLIIQSCSSQSEKINGLSFVASSEAISEKHINPVINVNANYCAIMPFGFMKNLDQPEIIHNTERQWFGETRDGAKQYIEELEKKGIKIMIKPQIWVWNGSFTGHIEMKSEAEWKTFEDSYTRFIMAYVQLAQQVNADIFCIGTELEKFVTNRPEYWDSLIIEIKKVYKGKLTYAANWDEFKRTPFWKSLDYIGVDAYFPINKSKTPSVEECIEGWKTHKNVIKELSDTFKKPVLFTEYGYRSMDFTAKEPWVSDHTIQTLNFEAQTNATKALFETFWNEEWFAGGFVWKWFHNHEKVGGEKDNQFTPQNKPVEKLIKAYYSKE